ncbi:MAG TPA: hypothetical protein VMB18_11660 [Terriglobales bacterium]|nr:hypothetical protein [Terriglobales bacterium]
MVAHNAQWRMRETLPAIHPRELPENNQLPAIVAALFRHLTYALASTLLEMEGSCNKKLQADCAETVEQKNCLWKVKEKAEKDRPQICTGENRRKKGAMARAHFFCLWELSRARRP